jgi:hypothetical protein
MKRVTSGSYIVAPSDLKDIDAEGMIPKEVFNEFAVLIRSRWNGKDANFTEKAVLDALDRYEFSVDTIRNGNWIEGVCDAYRENGWTVTISSSGCIKFVKPPK